MVWIETPTNPTLKLVDIEKTVKLVRAYRKDIIVVVDNTFMSPFLQVCSTRFFPQNRDTFIFRHDLDMILSFS